MKGFSLVVALGMVMVGLAQVGFAHLTPGTGSAASDAATGDRFRWSGDVDRDSNGVSGSYVFDGDSVRISSNALPPAGPLFPGGVVETGGILCDFEVFSDGNAATPHDNSLDESFVDDAPSGGAREDGTWDDGGINGACHTHSDFYVTEAYNTAGCPGHSHAEDAVLAGEVWIGAACDYLTPIVVDRQPLTPLICIVNNLFEPVPQAVIDCTYEFLECLPFMCFVTPPIFFCGADGTFDDINYGPGGASGGSGVPYPPVQFDCPPESAQAATFVLAAATVDVTPGQYPPVAHSVRLTPSAGWIDWTATASG